MGCSTSNVLDFRDIEENNMKKNLFSKLLKNIKFNKMFNK